MKANYINYKKMQKEFYTLKDAANLLDTTRPKIERLCLFYGIELQKNHEGETGLNRTSMTNLHHYIYRDTHKSKPSKR